MTEQLLPVGWVGVVSFLFEDLDLFLLWLPALFGLVGGNLRKAAILISCTHIKHNYYPTHTN
jgi:hypothetical protein